MIHEQIIAEGTAVSSKYAKLKASQHALDLLTGLAPFEYRIQYRCDCSQVKAEDGEGVRPLDDVMGSAI